MSNYTLCDSCHSPYDSEKNCCLVCDHVKDIKLVRKEKIASISSDSIITLALIYSRWNDLLKKIFRYTVLAAIAVTAFLLVTAIYNMIISEDLLLLYRALFLFERIWLVLIYGFTEKLIPIFLELLQTLVERIIIVSAHLWEAISGLVVRLLMKLEATIDLILNKLAF
jgi:hypothetical protein